VAIFCVLVSCKTVELSDKQKAILVGEVAELDPMLVGPMTTEEAHKYQVKIKMLLKKWNYKNYNHIQTAADKFRAELADKRKIGN